MTYARSLLVIHNIAHQGRGPMAELSQMEVPASYREMFRLDDPIGGEHMNIMKAGIITAHRVVAVSHGYTPSTPLQKFLWHPMGVPFMPLQTGSGYSLDALKDIFVGSEIADACTPG